MVAKAVTASDDSIFAAGCFWNAYRLVDSNIGAEGARYLADTLMENSTLKELRCVCAKQQAIC